MSYKEVRNVFNLVHHFGNEEDQVTASVGFIFHINRKILYDFLKDIIELEYREKDKVEILTQVEYPEKQSIIDLQIKLEDRFIIFIESKIWGYIPKKQQLEKYAEILRDMKGAFQNIRLVLITQVNREDIFEAYRSELGLKDDEFLYYRWKDIQGLVEKHVEGRYKQVIKLFLDYLGDKMKDLKEIQDQRIKDIKEIMIVPVAKQSFQLASQKHMYARPMEYGSKDVQYIAFYRSAPYQKITHIAPVLKTEKNVLRKEAYGKDAEKYFTEKMQYKKNQLTKVYHLGDLVALKQPIEKGSKVMNIKFRYAKFDRFLNAKTLDDIY